MIILPESIILPLSKPALKVTLPPLQVRVRDIYPVSRLTLRLELFPPRECNLHIPDRRAAPRAPLIHFTRQQNAKVMVMTLHRHTDRLLRMMTHLDRGLEL